MSRVQGDLVTLVGCVVSLVSFCVLPSLVVPFSPFTFTGVQLVTSGDQILLPHSSVVQHIPAMLQNVPFIWVPPFLVPLLGLAALRDVWLTRREELADQGRGRGIITVAGLTLILLLCSCSSNAVAGFSGMAAHANTLSGVIHGSLLTPGFLGLVGGVIVWLSSAA
jgi:hypothetical protein